MKPNLAATIEDISVLKYPLYASPKLDGVRALVLEDGTLVSRSLKPIPNPHVNKLFGRREYAGLDGELILGSPYASNVYRETVGAVSRHAGEPEVTFYVFDNWLRIGGHNGPVVSENRNVYVLPQHLINSEEHLLKYEQDMLDVGYEGLMLRSPDAKYKFGRSTMKEQGLMKLKRFADGEFLLIGVEEELSNENVAKRNALGRTERSTAKAGMVATGRAGALHCKDLDTDVEFHCGTGLCDVDRVWFWQHRKRIVGKYVGKYKSFKVGVKDLPRFPVFLGERAGWDV